MLSNKTSISVWDTYSGVTGILATNKFWQLEYREPGSSHVHPCRLMKYLCGSHGQLLAWGGVVMEALLIIRAARAEVLPCRFFRFCGGHARTTTTARNTFGCLSSPQFSSCCSFSRMTLPAPEMPALRIARRAKEPKRFVLEFFPRWRGCLMQKVGLCYGFLVLSSPVEKVVLLLLRSAKSGKTPVLAEEPSRKRLWNPAKTISRGLAE